jgi:hypothetical protein
MVTDAEYRTNQVTKATSALGVLKNDKSKSYDDAVNNAKKSDLQAAKNEVVEETNIAKYLKEGGSLLKFVLKDWKGGDAASGGTFSFPDKADVDAIRAIYGDIRYTPNVEKGDVIEYIVPCTGYDLFYISELGVKKRAFGAECTLDTSDNSLNIAKFVKEGLAELEKLYKGEAVDQTKVANFHSFIDATSAALYFYEAAGVEGLLSAYRRYIEQIAKIEAAHFFVDVYYEDVAEKVLAFAEEAKKAEEYGEMVRNLSLGYLVRAQERNRLYKNQKDEFLNNSNKEMNRVFQNARGQLSAHKEGKLYDAITGKAKTVAYGGEQ